MFSSKQGIWHYILVNNLLVVLVSIPNNEFHPGTPLYVCQCALLTLTFLIFSLFPSLLASLLPGAVRLACLYFKMKVLFFVQNLRTTFLSVGGTSTCLFCASAIHSMASLLTLNRSV